MDEQDVRKKIIEKIQQDLMRYGNAIQHNTEVPIQDRCLEMDVVLDVMRFLNNYEENTIALNQYYQSKKIDDNCR